MPIENLQAAVEAVMTRFQSAYGGTIVPSESGFSTVYIPDSTHFIQFTDPRHGTEYKLDMTYVYGRDARSTDDTFEQYRVGSAHVRVPQHVLHQFKWKHPRMITNTCMLDTSMVLDFDYGTLEELEQVAEALAFLFECCEARVPIEPVPSPLDRTPERVGGVKRPVFEAATFASPEANIDRPAKIPRGSVREPSVMRPVDFIQRGTIRPHLRRDIGMGGHVELGDSPVGSPSNDLSEPSSPART